MKEDSSSPKHQASHSASTHKKHAISWLAPAVIIIAALILVGAALLSNSSNTGKSSSTTSSHSTNTSQTPNLSISPSDRKLTKGSSLSMEVWADAGNKSVNAVQANLTYPMDKLNFVNVDVTTSNFGVAAQAAGGNGKITIARGNTKPLTGKQLVAKINFTAAVGTGKATVAFAKSSVLISSTTNKNILAATYDGSYSLSQ